MTTIRPRRGYVYIQPDRSPPEVGGILLHVDDRPAVVTGKVLAVGRPGGGVAVSGGEPDQ